MRIKLTTVKIDVTIQNEGNIFLVHPHTPAAQEWIDEHIPDDAQMFGNAIVVEHRYIEAIVSGMLDDGLKLN
jgi:hypothetical protein